MQIAREINNKLFILWVLLLTGAVLSAQGTRLHVHYLECEQHLDGVTATAGHPPHGKIHLVTDASHEAHATAGLSDLDVSPEGLLKIFSTIDSPLAVFVSLLVLMLLLTCLGFAPPAEVRSASRWRYALSPPLRAPPAI